MNIVDPQFRGPISEDLICFGPFRLSTTERLLEKGGEPVQLGSRALDILIVLVERPAEVVSKKELIAKVWPDLVVDDGSLRYHILVLRKALGQGRSNTRYVTNVSGRGYCFVAARHIGHIACVRSPLPKRLAQHQDMIAKTAVIDHKVRPHFCDQLLLADHFGRTFDENDKNVESATAKLNRLAAFF